MLNQLGGKITDEEMRQMNYEVNVNNANPQAVAHQFLIEQQLIKK